MYPYFTPGILINTNKLVKNKVVADNRMMQFQFKMPAHLSSSLLITWLTTAPGTNMKYSPQTLRGGAVEVDNVTNREAQPNAR